MNNEANFRRRTAMTMFKDRLRQAEENLSAVRKHMQRYQQNPQYEFWYNEMKLIGWVISQLRTRRLGSLR